MKKKLSSTFLGPKITNNNKKKTSYAVIASLVYPYTFFEQPNSMASLLRNRNAYSNKNNNSNNSTELIDINMAKYFIKVLL